MPIANRPLYTSPNGDRWLLVRDSTGRLYVRHEANAHSGGTVTDFEFADFIARGGFGPEKQELLRLIGSLADVKRTVDSSS
jgi:hypothetical protein